MTRRSFRILLTAFCCLLAFATSAFAECAWVLWGEDLNQREWQLYDAHETKQQCHASIEKHKAVWRDSPLETKFVGDKIILLNKGTLVNMVTFSCFPDTVDPRGPKRK
jgi:hypothetical protein